MASSNSRGRLVSGKVKSKRAFEKIIRVDHNYADISGYCFGHKCRKSCKNRYHAQIPKSASRDSWKHGRRTVELGALLQKLRSCSECRMGPIPLTEYNVVGELRKGLGGYLFVRCENIDCRFVNRVAYGKIPRLKKTGVQHIAANTKLGVATMDSSGGSRKRNNVLATLNVNPIPEASSQRMECRAGQFVESSALNAVEESSSLNAVEDVFKQEMRDISTEESSNSASQMPGLVEDLGACYMPDASPATVKNFELHRRHFVSPTLVIKEEQGS